MTSAIILAAGRGSRLYPFTEDCPKCLTVIGEKSLLDYQIQTLRRCGIDDIIVVNGYLGEMLERSDVRRIENANWASTNMVESLFCAESEFGNDILICYADILYEPRVIETLLSQNGEMIVAVNTAWRTLWEMRFDDPLSDAESLRLNDEGQIIDIGNKVNVIEEIEGQFMGLMRFRGTGISALQHARRQWKNVSRPWMISRNIENAYMTDLLQEIILSDGKLVAAMIYGGWLEIDTIEDYHLSNRLFTSGDMPSIFNPMAVAE